MGKNKHFNYDTIKRQALRAINKKKLVFISEVISLMPMNRNTFYNYKFHEDEDIIDALNANKNHTKKKLRDQWEEPGANPILQVALYKVLGDTDEKIALGVGGLGNKENSNLTININTIKELSDADLERLISEGRKVIGSGPSQLGDGQQNGKPLQLNP